MECEALSQKLILDIVRSRLVELLPAPLSSVLAREKKQRELLEAAIKAALRNPLVARYFETDWNSEEDENSERD